MDKTLIDILNNMSDEEIKDYIEGNDADSYLSSMEFQDSKLL